MKNPNGYGTVYKLAGSRRKPFVARKTAGWKWLDRLLKATVEKLPPGADPDELLPDGRKRYTPKQAYINIGYYKTRQEAMMALAEFNRDPYELGIDSMTLADLYGKWSTEHYQNTSDSNIKGCQAAWLVLERIQNMKLTDLKLDHFQKACDDSGKHTPTLRKVKILLSMMYDYAVKHEYLRPEKKAMIRYIDVKKAGNPDSIVRNPFTSEEIAALWEASPSSEYVRVLLMLIYSGCRISELLDLKKDNVNLPEKWFFIEKSKTESGIRRVPINEKVLPFFEEWYTKNDCEYLVSTPKGRHFSYNNYCNTYFKPLLKKLKITDHTPHDTRHTCSSLLAEANVDGRFIERIIGHKGKGVTDAVYTHIRFSVLLEAINKI